MIFSFSRDIFLTSSETNAIITSTFCLSSENPFGLSQIVSYGKGLN